MTENKDRELVAAREALQQSDQELLRKTLLLEAMEREIAALRLRVQSHRRNIRWDQ